MIFYVDLSMVFFFKFLYNFICLRLKLKERIDFIKIDCCVVFQMFIVNLVKQWFIVLGWWMGLNDFKIEGVWVYDMDFNNLVLVGFM